MATIQARRTTAGKRRYCAIVRRKGFPSHSKTFARKRDAAAWAATLEADMTAGSFQRASTVSVAELIARYIAAVCPTKRTGDRTAQQLRTWSAYLGDFALNDLGRRDIVEARDAIAAAGRGPGTVVRYLAALSHCFTIAIKDWQLLENNPVLAIQWPKEPRGRVRFLSDDERGRLLRSCQASKNPELWPLVSLAIMTGCRRGELVGLPWAGVDLDRSRIILDNTKNNERRQVPLMPPAKRIVERLARRRQGLRVFTSTDARLGYAFRVALKAARIDDFRFHDLRHSAASYLAMSGATTQEIAEILGHRTLSMVQRYAHMTTKHAAKVLDRMGDEFFAL